MKNNKLKIEDFVIDTIAKKQLSNVLGGGDGDGTTDPPPAPGEPITSGGGGSGEQNSPFGGFNPPPKVKPVEFVDQP